MQSTARSQPGRTEVDEADLPCFIRQLFNDGRARDRASALRELARLLGHQRLGPRVRLSLESALRTAVRRGILQNVRGELSLYARSVTDCDAAFLKSQFLAAIGRAWITRQEASRCFARWLGYRRTGPHLETSARSCINSLLRSGHLEKNGSDWIRRA
ncbi:MAG: hypothetical protein JNJ70_16950 [Verrucomicrobiales bacterium]|nr:hypothetical protein [Verrucomicrobiales bacterium]